MSLHGHPPHLRHNLEVPPGAARRGSDWDRGGGRRPRHHRRHCRYCPSLLLQVTEMSDSVLHQFDSLKQLLIAFDSSEQL